MFFDITISLKRDIIFHGKGMSNCYKYKAYNKLAPFKNMLLLLENRIEKKIPE